MKKILVVLCLAALFASCGSDNSSRVAFQLDGNGCLVNASGYDWSQRVMEKDTGIWVENYVWECADYTNLAENISVKESKVTLTFEGTTCLQLTSAMVGVGYCIQGASPVL